MAAQVVGARAQQQHSRACTTGLGHLARQPALGEATDREVEPSGWARRVEGHGHDADDDVGRDLGGEVEVGRRVDASVDERAAPHPLGLEEPGDGARSPHRGVEVGADRVAAAEDHPASGPDVDGDEPQRLVRPLDRHELRQRLVGIGDGEEAAGEQPADLTRQGAAPGSGASTAAGRTPSRTAVGRDRSGSATPPPRGSRPPARWRGVDARRAEISHRSSVLMPERSMAPTIEPADVPTTTSASSGRKPPTSSSARRTPA